MGHSVDSLLNDFREDLQRQGLIPLHFYGFMDLTKRIAPAERSALEARIAKRKKQNEQDQAKHAAFNSEYSEGTEADDGAMHRTLTGDSGETRQSLSKSKSKRLNVRTSTATNSSAPASPRHSSPLLNKRNTKNQLG